jgi:uncharacterized radical SAM protein YgiQ
VIKKNTFLPITIADARARGWEELDVIFVTGDAYVDHPAFGVPLLARWLENNGFRVGIIAQPDWRSKEPFMALGRPRLFFAVSAGAMDSMVAHYTPARKLRRDDAFTPGNRHGARPNRALMVYTSRLKEAYRNVPVIIGGIEASLRRFAHYDFWDDRVRRSVLLDSKADLLVYGMGERPLLDLAKKMRDGEPFQDIKDLPGTAYVAKGDVGVCPTLLEIPSYEEVSSSGRRFAEAFLMIDHEQNAYCGATIFQRCGDRLVVCNPPSLPMTEQEMDAVYDLPFEKAPHCSYKELIPAYEQIRNSITTHRGCFGGCAFCAITHHQGKTIQSRSKDSVLKEIGKLTKYSWFKGTISDVGGPTANMFGLFCQAKDGGKDCRRGSCLYPRVCSNLHVSGKEGVELLKSARTIPKVKHLVVSSGLRYDLLELQPEYSRELIAHHVGGLLKVAPEHLVDKVTRVMRKPGHAIFESFVARFREESDRVGKKQHLVPYFISGHPGCTISDMVDLALYLKRKGLRVEQVQDFTPTPGTLATCMYYSGVDPYTMHRVHVPKSDKEKRLQKSLLLYHLAGERENCLRALRECGREEAATELLSVQKSSIRENISTHRFKGRKY